MEQLHDSCGVVGIYCGDANTKSQFHMGQYLIRAMMALQHRGQESAGIALYQPSDRILRKVGLGHVYDVFPDQGLTMPAAHAGIGHVRYSTHGSNCIENAGPFVVGSKVPIALAHNGTLVNGEDLKKALPEYMLSSGTDSEAMGWLLWLAEGATFREKAISTISLLHGAYSCVFLAEAKLYALRDPWGLRPLCLGQIEHTWIVTSETCALDALGASFVREIEPGELVSIDENEVKSEILLRSSRKTLCVFEHIYFSSTISKLNNTSIYSVREALGKELAQEHPVDADLVVGVPDTAIPAALGYSMASGIPYRQVIQKDRYSGRTFIEPTQHQRQLALIQKFSLVGNLIKGKRLIVVDDSIVRGNTLKQLISMLHFRGAREVHLRSSAPPLRNPCYFGIDLPDRTDMIAARYQMPDVEAYLGADSLGYLSLHGLERVLYLSDESSTFPHAIHNYFHSNFCYGCMNVQGWPFNPDEKKYRHQVPVVSPVLTK